MQSLFAAVAHDSEQQIFVDLENQRISIEGISTSELFEISPYKKHCLMNGLDDIDYLISKKTEIEKFEEKAIA